MIKLKSKVSLIILAATIMNSNYLSAQSSKTKPVKCPIIIADSTTGIVRESKNNFVCFTKTAQAKNQGYIYDNNKEKPLRSLKKTRALSCPKLIGNMSNGTYDLSKGRYTCFRQLNIALKNGYSAYNPAPIAPSTPPASLPIATPSPIPSPLPPVEIKTNPIELTGVGDSTSIPFKYEGDLIKITASIDPETCPDVIGREPNDWRTQHYGFAYLNVDGSTSEAHWTTDKIEPFITYNKEKVRRLEKPGMYYVKVYTGAPYNNPAGYYQIGKEAPNCKWKVIIEPIFSYDPPKDAFLPFTIEGTGKDWGETFRSHNIQTEVDISLDPETCPATGSYLLDTLTKGWVLGGFANNQYTDPDYALKNVKITPIKGDLSSYKKTYIGKVDISRDSYITTYIGDKSSNLFMEYDYGDGSGGSNCKWKAYFRPFKR